MSKDWVYQMQSQIADTLNPKSEDVPTSSTTTQSASKKQQSKTIVLLLVVVVIGLGVLLMWQHNENLVTANVSTNVQAITNSLQPQPQSKPPEDIKQTLKRLDDRVSVLGAAHNNNWYALMQGQSVDNIVMLERDWKLDKMLPALNVAEPDRSFFEQWSVK
jgi:uncharacterized protein HemX